MDAQELKYQGKDFKNSNQVRWCPGCGDHAVLSTLQKAMAEIGVAPEKNVVISGIGCSSRLPYYMNTYAFHTIHGRGAAVATGVKVANPELIVWLATGDGDSMAIGGNHFIHAIRRNVDINIILFNNRIYGLTKGQYSPTSARGFVSKSSPYGTVEDPFVPAELVLGARGKFFARSLDVDMKTLQHCMSEGAKHRGASVVEVLVNCVIFNHGIHQGISARELRDERTVLLEHGKPMIYGKNMDKGIILEKGKLKGVTLGEGFSIEDVLIHDTHDPDPTLHHNLAMMGTDEDDDRPIAMGVIRDVSAPTYDWAVQDQVEMVKEKNPVRSLRELLLKGSVWEVQD